MPSIDAIEFAEWVIAIAMLERLLATILDKDQLRDQLIKDACSLRVVNTARFVASFYLGLPLLVAHSPDEPLPTLYEWPSHSSQGTHVSSNRNDFKEAFAKPSNISVAHEIFDEVDRTSVGNEISEKYSHQFPAIILWLSKNYIETIYYADQFCDLKSQAMLRFLIDRTLGYSFEHTLVCERTMKSEKLKSLSESYLYVEDVFSLLANDLRSLQIIASLDLLNEYCKSLVESAFEDLHELRVDMASLAKQERKWEAIVVASLEVDAVAGTLMVPFARQQLLTHMQHTFATMQPTVPQSSHVTNFIFFTNGSSKIEKKFELTEVLRISYESEAILQLPRPPVYMLPTWNGEEGHEQANYFRLHVLVHAFATLLRESNVLVSCIDHCCLSFAASSSTQGLVSVRRSSDAVLKQTSAHWIESFMEFLLLMLQLIYRDLFSIQKRFNSDDAAITMKKYKALLLLTGDDCLHESMGRWISEADVGDIKQICALFDYLRSKPSTTPTRSEYDVKNMHLWAHGFLTKKVLTNRASRNSLINMEQLPAVQVPQVSQSILCRAEFLAENWSYPVTYDERYIGMSLLLCPNLFVSANVQQIEANPSDASCVSVSRKLRRDMRSTVKRLEYADNSRLAHECLSERMAHLSNSGFEFIPTEASLQNSADAVLRLWPQRECTEADRQETKVERKLNAEVALLERKAARISEYIKSSRESVTRNSNASSRSKESGILVDAGSDGDLAVRVDSDKDLFSVPNSAFINDEIHSLDSTRSPDRPDIEPLDLGLLSPQPNVRAHSSSTQLPHAAANLSPATHSPDTGYFEESLPGWLKLIPVEKPRPLLSLQVQLSPKYNEDKPHSHDVISPKLAPDNNEAAGSLPSKPSNVSRKFELVTVMSPYQMPLLRDNG
ncbi:unnamed protein product [Toxocara canis]|uniref:Vps8 domain-containing protein n=1 Tax=Toxocara canis TaxID=6265 RepID=A0A183UDE7_TOXCA|nr:unnamed protein product [Toxocara canis]